MKYLSSAPFSIAVTEGGKGHKFYLDSRRDSIRHAASAKRPHEYLNGGSMCQICGLVKEVDRHVKVSEETK